MTNPIHHQTADAQSVDSDQFEPAQLLHNASVRS
jgi:hypothetical protein